MQGVFENIGTFVHHASEDLLVLVVEVATIAVKVAISLDTNSLPFSITLHLHHSLSSDCVLCLG